MRHGNPFAMGFVVLLLGGAVAVRAIEPRAPAAPVEEADLPILQPMQLLRAGGEERLAELDALVALDRRVAFIDTRLDLLDLDGCPPLGEWIRSRRGLALEQTVGALLRGTRTEALAGLALVMHLGRTTQWNPGFFGGSQGAERLGGLLGTWLETWGERAVSDPLLYEPALAAALTYGHVMNVAYEGNLFTGSQASLERARVFLRRLTGAQGERRTALGIALQSNHPRAMASAETGGDLSGFTREIELSFPSLDGDCGK